MYLDLLEKCLLDAIYSSNDLQNGNLASAEQIDNGTYFPARAHTMIGAKRLKNIRFCVEDVIKNNIEGDLIETGVWRGGAAIFMKGIIKFYNHDRKVYVADSFEGLPLSDPRYPVDKPANSGNSPQWKFLAVSQVDVENNFRRYDLLDDKVIFIKGFFEHSLPNAPIDKLSILRMDGDMYSSTIQTLNALYDKVSVGGYIIIDDYYVEGCKAAVDDFRRSRNITTPLGVIDWTGRFWKKESP